jgi:hypothetical protein
VFGRQDQVGTRAVLDNFDRARSREALAKHRCQAICGPSCSHDSAHTLTVLIRLLSSMWYQAWYSYGRRYAPTREASKTQLCAHKFIIVRCNCHIECEGVTDSPDAPSTDWLCAYITCDMTACGVDGVDCSKLISTTFIHAELVQLVRVLVSTAPDSKAGANGQRAVFSRFAPQDP